MRLRFTAFTILLLVLSTGLIGTVAVWTTSSLGYTQTLEQLKAITEIQRGQLRKFVDDLVIDLGRIAEQPSISRHIDLLSQPNIENDNDLFIANLQDRFRSIVARSPHLDEVFLLSPDGYVIASSEEVVKKSFRRHEYYFKQIAFNKKDRVVYIQDRVYSANAEQLNAVIAAIDVKRHGDAVYVLAVRTSTNALNKIVANWTGLGQTGEVILVSSNQSLVTNSRFNGFSPGTAFLASDPIALTLQDRQHRLGSFIDYRGHQVTGSYSYLPAFNAVLVAKKDQSEAMQPVYQLLWYSFYVMVPVTLSAIFIAVMVARRTTAPLLGLEQATTAISQGNYSLPIPIARKDEIGRLAENFDRMRGSIRVQLHELDKVNKELVEEIEQRRSAESQLQEAKRMESIGRVAGGVAHDFNNMLSVIAGFTDLCMSKVDESGQLHRWLNEILSAVQRSSSLTGQLLAYSRRQAMNPKVHSLADLIHEHEPAFREILGSGIECQIHVPSDPTLVNLDADQFSRVLVNFATNSRDALGSVGTFSITLFVVDDQAQLCIQDSGPGIDPAIKEDLFEPFVTTKGVGKGTGLGLAMIQGIVTQSGGTIALIDAMPTDVPAQPLSGAKFLVTFALSSHVEKALPCHDAVDLTKMKDIGLGKTILVVDDEGASVRFLQPLLEAYGYTVVVTESARWALANLADINPDLLLSDVKMPEMNGDILASAAKEQLADLQILLISGAVDKDQSYGSFPVLAKPLSRQSLLETVTRLIPASIHSNSLLLPLFIWP